MEKSILDSRSQALAFLVIVGLLVAIVLPALAVGRLLVPQRRRLPGSISRQATGILAG